MTVRNSSNGNGDRKRDEVGEDDLIDNYRAIINELSLLTTVSVLLFGFLLAANDVASSDSQRVLYALSITTAATSTLIFILPVVYHQLDFPFRDFKKFYGRAHFWMLVALPILLVSFYLTLALTISAVFDDVLTIIISGVPLAGALIAFELRKF